MIDASKGTSASPPAGKPGWTVDLAGIRLAHPVMNASGTFDALAGLGCFGEELVRLFPFSAYVTKTVTVEPRQGNPTPRIFEVAAGLINSIGLPNKGIDGFARDDLGRLASLPVPVVLSVAGFDTDEWRVLVERGTSHEEVAAIELNASCPNVKSGRAFSSDAGEIERLLGALRPLTEKPLIAKLSPDVADIAEVAAGAEAGGANAVSLINTPKALALDCETGNPWLGGGTGGLSGPAIKPVALAAVAAVADRISLSIVGMGGISSGGDALEFLRAGATCVAVGTENFRDPGAGLRIRAELSELVAPSERKE